jgi:hypothetical protein
MPKDILNPFKPNSPVATGIFSGRIMELERIDEALYSTKNGNPINMLIIGERGIGKTSLLLLMDLMSRGLVQWSDRKYNFVCAHIGIDEDVTILDIARRIKNKIETILDAEDPVLGNIRKVWETLKRFEVSGISYIDPKECVNPIEAIDVLIRLIGDTANSITGEEARIRKDGIVLLIDEADNANKRLRLGALVKYMAESLITDGSRHVLLVLAGLPRLREVLRESHESSLRIFEEHELATLSDEEAKSVIRLGINEINKSYTGPKIDIYEEALNLIALLSEGYPHFIQQIGASTIDTIKASAEDQNMIDSNTVKYGFTRRGGALERLGDRYYKDMYLNKIKEEAYRNILKIMASSSNQWVSKAEIRKAFRGKTSTLDNGIQALKERNIILSKPGSRGQYRLQWRGFAIWINLWEKYYSTNSENKGGD